MIIEASQKRNIVLRWLVWHFYEAPKCILKAFKNFLIFNFNYFSISLLSRTLFSHWRRYQETYGKRLNVSRYAKVFIGNITSRILGAIVRLATIIFGLICELLIFIGGVVVFLIWLFLPILLLLGLYFGLKFLT